MSNWFSKSMKDEVPFEEIEEKANNGEFHEWSFQPFEFQEIGYEGVMDKLKSFKAPDYLNEKDPAKQEAMVDEVLKIYREVNVFPIQYYSEFGIQNEIEKCIGYKAAFNGDTVSCGAGIGTTLCNFLFPNLFDTPSKHDLDKKGAETLYAKFHNDDYLRRAIKFCFSYKDGCPTPTNVMGGLRLVGSAPTNFRPMNAKAVYERFCPEGGTIYDFCCVDNETEFFNGKEWKSLADYVKGDKVLQYNEDGTAELVDPIEYIHYQSDAPFYEYNHKGFNTCLTGNHDVVLQEGMFIEKIKFDDVIKRLEAGEDVDNIPVVALIKDSEFSVHATDEELMSIYCSIILEKDMGSKYVEVTGLEYSLSDSIFTLDIDSRVRLLRLFGLDIERDFAYYSTENKFLAEKLTSLWNVTCGWSLVCHCADDLSEDFPELRGYFLTFKDANKGYCNCTCYEAEAGYRVISNKRDKYCFVVPSHMLVLRRNGFIFVTGNCGFGGRMLGALSSKKNFKYVGTDPNVETMYHLHQLGDYIEQVTGREDSYELHCCGSEDFRGPANSIDFAFSSPPYFDLEVYSDDPTQCYNKFPELEEWLEGYVRQTIKNIYHMLKPGRCYAVNIADFKVGSGGECAYVDEWIRLSTEEGMPLFDTVYLGVTARAGSKEQAAGELKKENILIFKKPL